MAGIDSITDQDIEMASRVDDVDAALAPIADKAAVESGDVAGMVFAGFDWISATVTERAAKIRHYIAIERIYADDAS